MNTVNIYITIELASLMTQPWKSIKRLHEILQLLPCDGSHINFQINKLLKDYFMKGTHGKRLIAYIEDRSYYIDIHNEDETLDDIKNKHLMIGMIHEDGRIKVRMA